MAMTALKTEREVPVAVEERVARLEVSVDHIQSDVSEVKTHIQRLDNKIDEVDKRLSGKSDDLKDALAALALKMEESFAALKVGRAVDKVWWLTIAGVILGVMARGFEWI